MAAGGDVLRTLSLPRLVPLRVVKTREASIPAAFERLVVVGNGMVGQRFCETLIKLGGPKQFKITVLGDERIPAYDRVHLTDIWKGRDPRELVLRDQDWYRTHGVELRLGERVRGVDTDTRVVTTETGAAFPYDRLVFATGSHVPVLRVELEPGVELLSYRTIEDAQRILTTIETAGNRRVVVVGGGLLGLEAARALQRLGCDVTVLEVSSQVLPRQLDAVAAEVLEQIMRGAGLEIRTRCRLTGIAKAPGGYAVRLEGAADILADVVVAAVGARATDGLARDAGLTCEVSGGIRVDDKLRTSKAGVYAIGECAHHRHVPQGLVAPGYAMADVLAQILMGQRERLGAQHAVTRLKLDLTEVTVLGNPLAPDAGRDLAWHEDGVYRRLVVNGNKIVAAVCIGAWSDLPALQRVVTTRQRVSKRTLNQFAETGALSVAGGAASVQSFADGAIVCSCANVSCGTLRRAVLAGNADVTALGRVTSAGTLCGSCQPQLAELCGGPAAPVDDTRGLARALVIVSAFTFIAALVTTLVPRLPIATSVRLEGVDVLWVDGLYKQISGFVLIGLIAIGLLLSLRKRVKRFRWGTFPGWRVLHASLGLGALVVAFAHTGFRLGYNLNFILMVAFLFSALSGAVSGAFLSKLSSAEACAASVRAVRVMRTLHDWVFWPFLVLLSFHVLKVYYF